MPVTSTSPGSTLSANNTVPSELPTLAYTGSAAPSTWLLTPALGILGLGGLALGASRRRTQLSQ